MARTTKCTEKFMQTCYSWVCEHGLYPEPNGATVKMFCDEVGITHMTYLRWCDDNVNFVNTIKKANDVFRTMLVKNLERSLYDQAMGNFTQKKKRTRIINEDGKPQVKETIIDEVAVAPNATATIFALKNISPERWRDKQEHDIKHINPISIKVDDETMEAMNEYFGLANK